MYATYTITTKVKNMIKIQIKRVLKTGETAREQHKTNKYDIIMSIDNCACETLQMYISAYEVRTHIQSLIKTIPFAIVEIENPEIWEENIMVMGSGANYQAVKTTA